MTGFVLELTRHDRGTNRAGGQSGTGNQDRWIASHVLTNRPRWFIAVSQQIKSRISIIYTRLFFETVMVEEAGIIKEVWFANPHILRVGSNNMPEKSLFSNVYFKSVFLHSPSSFFWQQNNRCRYFQITYSYIYIAGMHILPMTQSVSLL